MNDRAQAGTADNGAIQLIQQRVQIRKDKYGGWDESPREVDRQSNGVHVNAQYFMQIHGGEGSSKQRQVQLMTD